METSLKVLKWTFRRFFLMGNHRTDLGKDFMESGMTLITDPRSDKYLNRVKKVKNAPSKDDKNGFDDYVERLRD